ncbi:MAG: capsid protein [Genomoviridae sp.]|nr:MAG: capsid protein [Genomoviridae sp.]
MAYRFRRRFGRARRSYRRRPVRRYSRRGRSGYGRGGYNRRRPRRRRRSWISPYNKKHDVIKGAHDTNDNSFAPIGAPNTFFGFCPTYMPNLVTGDTGHNPSKVRTSKNVGYTGYQERVHIATAESLIWRRIVIWSYNRLNNTAGPSKTDSSGTSYTTRQITPLQLNEGVRAFLFRGTQGVDYTENTLHEAPLNADHFTVAYDRTRVLQPRRDTGDEYGHIFNMKFWNPGGRIIYSDDEDGLQKGSEVNGWSSLGRSSKGNMYIFDVFSTGYSLTSDTPSIARFAPTGTRYWVEG